MLVKIILLSTLVIGIGIDIYLALSDKHRTFSQQITEWGEGRFPILILFLSYLLGHFFFPYKIDMPFWVSFLIFIVSGISIQVIRIFNKLPKWANIIIMVYGILLGSTFT